MDNPVYALSHTDEELERLIVQSRFVEPVTRQYFQVAGISTQRLQREVAASEHMIIGRSEIVAWSRL